MACKKEGVPFSGTPEQEAALKKVIAELKDTKGALMPIMQQAQEIYGYLPIEVQTMISDETGIPLEKIYGVSTFYAQFALQPKGKYQISVCLGTACYVKGSGAVFNKLEELLGITNGECTPDGRFSLDSCRCVNMACKKEGVPFSGTPEQEAALKKVIAELKDTKGALMPIMQQAQEIYGYLPIEVQTMISDETGIPLEKIYGVSTFYAQFALQPKGKYQISVCLGTACYVKGSGAVFNKLEELLGITNGECTPDGRFSLDSCRCVGACGLAPVMMINEEVYGRLTADDIPGILAKYQ